MQVEALLAGDERHRLLGVGAEFLRRAGFAGIIAGGDQAAAEGAAEIFKSAHVIALPAVEGHRDIRERFQHAIHVHAGFGVAFFGQIKGFFDVIFGTHDGCVVGCVLKWKFDLWATISKRTDLGNPCPAKFFGQRFRLGNMDARIRIYSRCLVIFDFNFAPIPCG
jgi:hypothetical protein